MTTLNNYNTNANGHDIEISCFWDIGHSQWRFDENFESIQTKGYSKYSVLFYTDNGQLENTFGKLKIKGTVKEMRRYYDNNHGGDVRGLKKSELQEEILYHEPFTCEEDITRFNESLHRYNYDLELVHENKLVCIESRGYNQGDYAEVWIDLTQLEKLWGKAPDISTLKKEIHRLLWDCPLHMSATIDGEEYTLHEIGDFDEYEYEPQKIAEALAKESGAPEDEILALLPKNPDYQ